MRKDNSIAPNDATYSIAAYNTSPFKFDFTFKSVDNFQWVIGTLVDFLTLLHSSGGLSANQTQNFPLTEPPKELPVLLYPLTLMSHNQRSFWLQFYVNFSPFGLILRAQLFHSTLNSIASCRNLLTFANNMIECSIQFIKIILWSDFLFSII